MTSSPRPLDMTGQFDTPDRKKDYNARLFTEVAPAYDRITRILSFGRDAAWKRHLVAALPALPAPACLDIACGTGDLCALLATRYPEASITGLDLTPSMLEIARQRFAEALAVREMNTQRLEGEAVPSRTPARLMPGPRLRFIQGDMCALPVESASVDILTGGYAIRNAPDLPLALREIARVLKPGGTVAFLDFSKPPSPAAAAAELALLKAWGAFWGWWFHRKPDVYGYIAESLRRFPDRQAIVEALAQAGLRLTHRRLFLGGFTELLVARRMEGTSPCSSPLPPSPLPLRPVAVSPSPLPPPPSPFSFLSPSRHPGPELMDDPACDARKLLRTLDQFRLINRCVARYRTLLSRHVLADMARDPSREYTLVDLGAGGCDIPEWLLARARASGLRLRVIAIEQDARAAAHARRRCAGVAGLEIVEANAFDWLREHTADYVFANHFLHHLDDAAIVDMLRLAARSATRAVVFSDLLRSRLSYVAFSALGAIPLRDSFAWVDGRISVLRAFLPAELTRLAAAAGLPASTRIERLFPGRLALVHAPQILA